MVSNSNSPAATEQARASASQDVASLSLEERRALTDELSRKVVAGTQPLRFDVARDQAEREAAFRLRHQAVVAHGWLPPEAMPDGMEHDAYDEHAIIIVGWDGDTAAATTRLVLPTPGLRLPTEAAFGLTMEPQGQVVDMGRQTVARAYSNMRHRVFAAILAKTWLVAREHGYSLVCGDFSSGMLRLYRMMGFHVEQVGPAQVFWSEERWPILVDPARNADVLLQRWSPGPAEGAQGS